MGRASRLQCRHVDAADAAHGPWRNIGRRNWRPRPGLLAALALAFFVAACDTPTPWAPEGLNWTPRPAPSTGYKVFIVSPEELQRMALKANLDPRVAFHVGGLTYMHRRPCEIYLASDAARHVFLHELRHCQEGRFHP